MDIRQYFTDHEETLRSMVRALQTHFWTMLPVTVAKDGDGHTSTLKSTIKATTIDKDGNANTIDFPLFDTSPVNFAGGGGTTLTHPIAKGDEGIALFASRAVDNWHQEGAGKDGAGQPQTDRRLHSLSDAFHIPGVRSDPRKIPWTNRKAMHVRSDDAKHTIELHPGKGMHVKSVSDTSADKDEKTDPDKGPFNKGKTFYDSMVQADAGVIHNAVDDKTTHTVSLIHKDGHSISIKNGAHTITVHPDNGIDHNSKTHVNVNTPSTNIKSQNTTISGGQTTVSSTLNVNNILNTGFLNASSAASFKGGISSGAVEIASDADGGLMQVTMGCEITGGAKIDTLVLTGLGEYANDVDAAAGGVPLWGIYRSGSVIAIRQA